MLIKMTKDCRITPDGFTTQQFEKDGVYEVNSEVARGALRRGLAEMYNPEDRIPPSITYMGE